MAETPTPLAKKLVIKPGYQCAIINMPDTLQDELAQVTAGNTVAETLDGSFDWELVFVRNQADINTLGPVAVQALKPNGALWFAYPKQTAKVATDINRDRGWDAVRALGFRPVTQIALDPVWSALRFRPG